MDKLENMALSDVVARLAAIDAEVRSAQTAERVDELAQEKTELLARKAELDELEKRKQGALDVRGGAGRTFERRGAADAEDKFESLEYRRAFMRYVTRGTPIPAEYRTGDESTLTSDVPAVIPTPIANRIVEKMETIGVILPLVTRTNYATGIAIPTSSVKPTATWVSEGAGSDRQKKTTGTSITFGRFKLRCEIGWSAETNAAALPIFETTFTRQVSEAMSRRLKARSSPPTRERRTPRASLPRLRRPARRSLRAS